MIRPRIPKPKAVFDPRLSQKNIDLYVASEYRWFRTFAFTMYLVSLIGVSVILGLEVPQYALIFTVANVTWVLCYLASMAWYVGRPAQTRWELLKTDGVLLVTPGLDADTFYHAQTVRITMFVPEHHQDSLRIQLYNALMGMLRINAELKRLDFDMERMIELNIEYGAIRQRMIDAIDVYDQTRA